MRFQDKLAKLKERIEGNMSPAFVKIMHDATKALQASGIQERVLGVGASMPDFALPNQHGDLQHAADLLAKGPLVVTFYRGFWCPYCNADLENLRNYTAAIEAQGGTLIAISPEKPNYSKKIISMRKLNFDILTDARNDVAAQFGLRFALPGPLKELYRDSFGINLKLYHGDDDWTLPMPARFLVDPQGAIRYAESAADYTQRPDPDALMDVLKALRLERVPSQPLEVSGSVEVA